MKSTCFTPDLQHSMCREFMQQLRNGDYTTSPGIGSLSDEIANAFGVSLGPNVLFAHLIMGGSPYTAMPFINPRTDACKDQDFPQCSHPESLDATVQKLKISERTSYWALSIVKELDGHNWYGFARPPHDDRCLMTREKAAVSTMLRSVPVLHLFVQPGGQRRIVLQPTET